jgi:hypothetical protein
MTRSGLTVMRLDKIGNARRAQAAAILVAEMISIRGEKKIAHDFDLV